MNAQPIVRMPGEGQTITLGGQPMTFLVTGAHSRHTSMFEWTVPAGFSTGRHVHRVQEETFYILDGTCDIAVGETIVHATPGSYVFAPPGTPHNISNPGKRAARILMSVSPPGLEHYFEQLAELAGRGGRPDPDAVAALRRRFDTEQLSALKIC
jgi:quercetin dioxygenase-like cupin family protein